jgi:hypothetical protein
MKVKTRTTIFALLLPIWSACGQGVFQYDQQSADESSLREGTAGLSEQPLGQSFTPLLSSVGFIRIFLSGGAFGDGLFHINLYSDSITGTLIASTEAVTVTLATQGFVNFFFDNPVSVIPGMTYYFQPAVQVQGGNDWATSSSQFYNYPGGAAFLNGVSSPTVDLWFREGIVVPEPSAAALVLIGSVVLLYVRRSQNRPRSKV